ncbi:MarR family transcriptional regulator for hemolysin [Halopolyspora algeriensis]|uniref:MarR family transcriptional regulator for hemolysin n=1 Tax=Halopolyspora algeriensis TaxID=1500506 RepID=A0A368VZ03_9ACTN|nr:MarR family winged helix-turn-helix transcriptional regulator [Halopolyspora algeriensis]RCW46062.1 MarR family transcriptional regulator for hemolysin [Halopolyspora algeriensis]TQM55469.1 MarR family transcriptional regulator for hemolysin [Halopolyspora algeriensis]
MPAGPANPPLGLQLADTARTISRAFDDALTAAGGSRPTWLVLMALKKQPTANQRQLAAAVGIQGATLTHHLNAMESAGLLTRRRDPANRRVHLVELTEHGENAFHDLRRAAVAFDEQLRSGLDTDDVERLRDLLARLQANVAGPRDSGHQPGEAPTA